MKERNKIQEFYNKYFEILKLETEELGCRTTELRHLIGRLGEFYCALNINGELARTPNQHGFDVISEDGFRISVKTTAQKTGFITINRKTIASFDKLMVLQLVGLEFHKLYYGSMNNIEHLCRVWSGNPDKFELDISKLKNFV